MDIFTPLYSVLLLAVRTRIVRGATLLGTWLVIVVVVLFPTQGQLVALSKQRRGSTRHLAVCIPARQ